MPYDLELVSLAELDAYFRLSWLFAGLIALMTVLLMLLYLRNRRSERRGEQNAEVSLGIIQGQEEERRRVAGELHDAILPELSILAQTISTGGAALEHQRKIASAIRELCAWILPPDFENLSFQETLESLCAVFSRRGRMEFKSAIDNDLDLGSLDGEARLAIYRIVQEALTNGEKHAAGPVVLVARNSRLANGDPSLLICVSDHGPGLGKSPGKGLGLRIMRLRAVSLGASLDFICEKGNGLMVRLEIPVLP
ncbi:hypothetical protein AGMMS49928_14360 [Spirochaetia bacterium]|nr:hypothetical protein AGMMS49928_14360 [Spirochaetia bacterium]